MSWDDQVLNGLWSLNVLSFHFQFNFGNKKWDKKVRVSSYWSSFPGKTRHGILFQMTKFKQKQISNSQLLQCAEWFSKYSFETKHIVCKKNVLADFLSKPKARAKINMYIMRHTFHTFHHNKKYKIERIWDGQVWNTLGDHWTNPKWLPQRKSRNLMWQYHTNIFRHHGGSILYHLGLNSWYPFIYPLIWKEDDFSNKLRWLL